MAIMDHALVQGQTVFFPQSLKRIYSLESNQEIKIPNGWGHTALVFQGADIIGYCCIKNKFDCVGNYSKVIDSNH